MSNLFIHAADPLEEDLWTTQIGRGDRGRYEGSLKEFVEGAWSSIDSAEYQTSWAIDAMCDHLEAVTLGHINRLLINIPPRAGKTSIVSVIYPAWVWARSEVSYWSGPQVRFLCASFNHDLALRASTATRRLIYGRWFQSNWPGKIIFRADQNAKGQFDNTAGGSRVSTSVGSNLLGLGGDILIADDLNKVKDDEVESEAERDDVRSFWNEFSSTRLNDPKRSAIIGVQQRLHQSDMSGLILDGEEDYVHLCLPMRYEPDRHCVTVKLPQSVDDEPWEDPRGYSGEELMWPERFGEREVRALESKLGPFMAAGRLQQMPVPKGGGIIKREWWQPWDNDVARTYGLEWNEAIGGLKEFPDFSLIVASLDTSYGLKEENDYNAMTVWGIFLDRAKNRRAMMMYAWNKRLPLHGKVVTAMPGEAKVNFKQRQAEAWGLVELVADTCRRYKVTRLLIEDKTRGRDVAEEIKRLYTRENWGVELINPVGDKVSRGHSVVPLFTDGSIYSPEIRGRPIRWAEPVIQQCSLVPKSDHDDMYDTCTMFLHWARANDILIRADEMSAALEEDAMYRPPQASVSELYGVG